jgi:hypothetical protein
MYYFTLVNLGHFTVVHRDANSARRKKYYSLMDNSAENVLCDPFNLIRPLSDDKNICEIKLWMVNIRFTVRKKNGYELCINGHKLYIWGWTMYKWIWITYNKVWTMHKWIWITYNKVWAMYKWVWTMYILTD